MRQPTLASAPQISSTSAAGAPLAVEVRAIHAAPLATQSQQRDVAERTQAAERFLRSVAEWMSERWVTATSGRTFPCSEERVLEATFRVRLSDEARVETWEALEEAADAPFDDAARSFLTELRGEAIPTPSKVFADLRPRELEVRLSNRTFVCAGSSIE